MPLGLGFSINQAHTPWVYPGRADPTDANADWILNIIDGFRNSWADALGLPVGNGGAPADPFDAPAVGTALAQNAHLYPASFSIWHTVRNPTLPLSSLSPAPWTDPGGAGFPQIHLLNGLRQRGITPMIFIGLDANNIYRPYKWSNWSVGLYDDWLDQWAQAAKAWATNDESAGLNWQGRPKSSLLLIRYGWEQNGSWMPWSVRPPTATTGIAPADQPAGTVAEFKDGFAHIANRIRKAPNYARNVKTIYCPILTGAGAQSVPVSVYKPSAPVRSALSTQYPGSAAVDYVGFDVYSTGVRSNQPYGNGPDLPGVDLYAWEPSMRSGWFSGYWEFSDTTDTSINNPFRDDIKPIIVAEFGESGASYPVTGTYDGSRRATEAEKAAFWTGTGWNSRAPTKDLAGGLAYVKASYPNIRLIQHFDFDPFSVDISIGSEFTGLVAPAVAAISDGRFLTDPGNKNTSFVGSLPLITGTQITEIAVLDADVDITDGTGMAITGDLTFTSYQPPVPSTDNASHYLYEGDDMDALEPVWD